jgi:hypothetical protein
MTVALTLAGVAILVFVVASYRKGRQMLAPVRVVPRREQLRHERAQRKALGAIWPDDPPTVSVTLEMPYFSDGEVIGPWGAVHLILSEEHVVLWKASADRDELSRVGAVAVTSPQRIQGFNVLLGSEEKAHPFDSGEIRGVVSLLAPRLLQPSSELWLLRVPHDLFDGGVIPLLVPEDGTDRDQAAELKVARRTLEQIVARNAQFPYGEGQSLAT